MSAARELMVDHPAMRPDLRDNDVVTGDVTRDDAALNSLCQFDIAYCFLVEVMGTGLGSAYPSSAAFDEDRAKPMAQKIVADDGLRHQLLPGFNDVQIAAAVVSTYETAISESANNYGGRWWAMPPSVVAFVNKNPTG